MKKMSALVIMMAFAYGCAIAQYPDLEKKTEGVVSAVAKEAGATTASAVDATKQTATAAVASVADISQAPVSGTEPAVAATQNTAMTTIDSAADIAKAAASAVAAPVEAVTTENKEASKKEFNVFTEKFDLKNHYIPSGWMGDYGDIQIDDGCTTDPHSGKTCFKVTYSAQGAQGAGWMGIYWQNPANNWGTQMGGYDLKGYKKLGFWARGDKGGEVISEFKVGGINGNYADSDSNSIGPVTLTKEWKQYTIDLKDMDLSYISGGFMLSASSKDNPEGFVIYLDDVKYEE